MIYDFKCEMLEEFNNNIREELLVMMMLSTLPRDVDHFVIAIEMRDELPRLTVLKYQLIEKIRRH